MIALLDYGSGNLRSVEKALRKVGADVRRVTGPGGLKEASAAVLPGVGAGFFNDQSPRSFATGSMPGPIFVGNFVADTTTTSP